MPLLPTRESALACGRVHGTAGQSVAEIWGSGGRHGRAPAGGRAAGPGRPKLGRSALDLIIGKSFFRGRGILVMFGEIDGGSC